jgi:hypothetical protein
MGLGPRAASRNSEKIVRRKGEGRDGFHFAIEYRRAMPNSWGRKTIEG